jgi:hypothetical protein
MSYQPTAGHSEVNYPPRPTSAMYNQSQIRTPRESQSQAATAATPTAEQMAVFINQFQGLTIPNGSLATGAAAMGVAQMPQMYFTQDGTCMLGPSAASIYTPQHMASGQLAEASYNPYQAAQQAYMAQIPYSGYAGYPMMPYATARAGYYPDRAEHHKGEVPGLENRRGSYSTNESAPSTPYYSALQREQGGTHIAADRSVFGNTPSPQQLATQHADQHVSKPLPYKTIPINVDLDALLVQHPVIPRAVPAVFTPRENMRTLDQSLSNPIPNNRNVYIRGLHPNTDDETLAAYASRFGAVETTKAIIDTSTGACKG